MTSASETFEQTVIRLSWTVVAPVQLVVGSLGNILSLVVILATPSFRSSPVGFSLGTLSLVDTGVLLTAVLPQWLRIASSWDLTSLTSFGCKTHLFVRYLLTHLSSWTVALLSADRAVTVARPLSRLPAEAGRARCRIVTAWTVVLMILVGINIHFFWTVKLVTKDDHEEFPNVYRMSKTDVVMSTAVAVNVTSKTPANNVTTPSAFDDFSMPPSVHYGLATNTHTWLLTGVAVTAESDQVTSRERSNSTGSGISYSYVKATCMVPIRYQQVLIDVWHKVDSVVWVIAPFIVILVSNLVIVISLSKGSCGGGGAERGLFDTTDSSQQPSFTSGRMMMSIVDNRQSNVLNSGTTLLCVSCAFLVTTLPTVVYMAMFEIKELAWNELFKTICSVIYYTGVSSNFALYCLSGTRFRQALRALVYRWFRRNRRMSIDSVSSLAISFRQRIRSRNGADMPVIQRQSTAESYVVSTSGLL